MARCGCGNGACSCRIIPGNRVSITGTGSSSDPYVISSDPFNPDDVPGILTINGKPGPNPSLDAGDVGALDPSNNLSEIISPGTARTNLSVYSKTEGDVRYTSSATADVNSIVVDRPSGPLEGLRYLWIYGNSYVEENGRAGSNYTDRLRLRIRPQTWFNGGSGGTNAADECGPAFGTAPVVCPGSSAGTSFASSQVATFPNTDFASFTCGLVLLDIIRNDAGYDGVTASGGTTAKSRAGFLNHVDALVRLFRAEYRIPNSTTVPGCTTTSGSPTVAVPLFSVALGLRGMPVTGTGIPANTYLGNAVGYSSVNLSSSATSQVNVNATATGTTAITIAPKKTNTWTTGTNTNGTKGAGTYTLVNGATATYNFYLSSARKVAWTTFAQDSNVINGSAFSVAVDGGTAITGTTNNQTRRSLFSFNVGYAQMCVPLGTLAAGYHSVVVTHTGSAGQSLNDDCLLVESMTPPTVVLPKSFLLQTAGYGQYSIGGGITAGPATDLIYDGILDTVVARFPSDQSVIAPNPKGVTVLGQTWDAATMISAADSVHKNDIGERWTTDWLMSVLNKLPFRAGLNRL